MRMLPIIGVAVAAVLVLIAMTFFRVDERQQALVLQFGHVEQVITEPGLRWKVPLIQDVAYYEDRILPLDTSALEVTPADERRLIVDAFARWRIDDVVQFRQSVQTEANALPRLERILNAALRQVLGSVQSSDVLSPERSVLMQRIRDVARSEAENLGVSIVDVRIRRADLPEQNLRATFERMEAERQREAADERARGEERAQEIRATADRAAVELVSDAQRQSEIIRGEADALRNSIYAAAYGRDEEFFAFYRSLTAYERALQGENSTMVLSPDSEFFDYLRADRGEFAPPPEAPVFVPEPVAGAADEAEPPATETATDQRPVVETVEGETTREQVERIIDAADDLGESVRRIEQEAPAARELREEQGVVDTADDEAEAQPEPATEDEAAAEPEQAAEDGAEAEAATEAEAADEGDGGAEAGAGAGAETVTEQQGDVTVTRTLPENGETLAGDGGDPETATD